MGRRSVPKRAYDDHDMIEVPGLGYIAYSWLEREAICLESGLSEQQALRVASTDYQRELTDTMKKRHGSSSYLSLPVVLGKKA